MARRNEHSVEQIREMVLNAAEGIIREEGIEALTVRKIALEIGYTVGSIYMVFDNMQDLVLHIKGRTLDSLEAELFKTFETGGIEQNILSLAGRYLEFGSRNYQCWRIIFEPLGQDNTEIPEWYQEKIERMFKPVEQLFRQLSPEKTPEQARLAAMSLWCGVHGVSALGLNGNLGHSGVENSRMAVNLLVTSFIRGWQL